MLEKSRVIYQAPNDRSFNIFYQLMSEKVKEIARKLDIKVLLKVLLREKYQTTLSTFLFILLFGHSKFSGA